MRRARKDLGYRDTTEWADKVGRSSRVVLGLERGEPTGEETLELVSLALGQPATWCEALLDGQADGPPVRGSVGPVSQDAEVLRFQRPPGLTDDEWDDLRRQQADYWEYLVSKAAKER